MTGRSEARETPVARQVPPAVWIVVALCTVVELALQLGDQGFLATQLLRLTIYEYGAFWPALLAGANPLFQGQPVVMFATYAFLHGGLLHLAANMLTLLSLGAAVGLRIGQLGFLVAYGAAAVAGGLGFAALSMPDIPMVGASGALFGLAGVLIVWEYRARRIRQLSLRPVWMAIFVLVLINVALWWMTGGHLAWEAHLGGFLAGVLFGALWRDDSTQRV